MATFKKNSKWYISGRIKKEDGTYYRYTKLARECKTVNEAEEFEVLFRKKWQNMQIAKNTMCFSELAKEYIEAATHVKAVTRRTDEDIIDKCNKKFGKKSINLFNKDYLQKFIKELESKYSKSYVDKYYYTISKIFKYAVNEDYLVVNPMQKVRKSAFKDEVKKEIQFWEPEEFEIFLKYVKNEEMKRIFVFLYYMGTRKGEMQALQWKDVDLKKGTVQINKTYTNKIKGKAWEITSPKTQNSIRTIIMPEIVKNALKEQQEYCMKLYGYDANSFVFGFKRPIPAETLRKNLERGIDAANKEGNTLKSITPHGFRHSHVSYLINNKSDQYTDFDIAQRMGDTVETIRRTYAHMFKDSDRKIIDFIDKDTSIKEINFEKPKKYDYINELKSLKELLDIGVITEEEFSLKKKQLLGI